MKMIGAFEDDTLHRMLSESARFWVIGSWLKRRRLPGPLVMFTYAENIDWGNDKELGPLRGKRIRIRLGIEDWR